MHSQPNIERPAETIAAARTLPAIIATREPRADEWDAIWRNDPTATGFHGRFWAEAWAAASGGRTSPRPLIVDFDDGAQALLPHSVQRLRRGLVRRTLSSPAGTYGGWIAGDALTPAHRAVLIRHLAETSGSFVWRLNPFDADQVVALSTNPMPVSPEQTLALDLDGGSDALARLWASRGNAVPRKSRVARRAGVEIRPARDLDDWRAYFEVYQTTLDRWGPSASSRYEWLLFAHLAAGDEHQRTLWLATVDDTVIAGALCLTGPRITCYWHGAARAEFFHLRPVNLLMMEIALDACGRGYRWFDLGPSGGHDGVARFKRSLGAIPLDCPVVRRVSAADRLHRTLTRASASRARP